MNIRLLTPDDLPGLERLRASANWNQTAEDFRRMLRIQPDGCFGIEIDGMLAASTSVVLYGGTFGWVGMVLTLPEFRGRGLARRLMEHAIEFAGDVPLRLDASDMGHHLYQSLGFVDEYPVERWVREPSPLTSAQARAGEIPYDLDAAAFGADRRLLLEDLAQGEWVGDRDGFAMWRPGANFGFLGPCTAVTADHAEHLIRAIVAHHAGERNGWDLVPSHKSAQLASELGFQPARRLMRMVRGAPTQSKADDRIWAIAGFEWG